MNLIRFAWSLVAATLFAACGGGPSSAPVASQRVETVPPAAEPDAGPAVPANLAASRATLQYLPRDVDTVAHVNWRKVREGKLKGNKLLADMEVEFLPMADKCGLDLPQLVDTVTIGLAGKGQPDETFIAVVVGDFNETQVAECLTLLGAATKAGHFVLDGEEFHLFWPKEGVVLASRKVAATDMQARLEKGSLLEGQTLMPWIRRTDSHADAWAAAAGHGMIFEGLGSFGGRPEGLYLNVDIDDAISIFVSLQFMQADHAGKMETLVQQINSARPKEDSEELQVDSIDVRREDRRLDVVIKLRPPTLASP